MRLYPKLFLLLVCFYFIACIAIAQHTVHKPIAYDEWKMKTDDGVKLYVTEFGNGDTVIVLHGGWGAEHAYLLSAVIPFTNKHHFVMYDQRGSLRSPCNDSLITVNKHIDDLETLRKKLGLNRFTILAHSMGNYLAMSYIDKYPGHVKKLIMMAAPPAIASVEDLTSKIQEPALARWDRPDVKQELVKYGLENKMKKSYTDQQAAIWDRITFGAINLHDIKHWREIKGGPMFYSNNAGIAAIKTMPDNWDFTQSLQKQDIKIYVLHGDDDYIPYTYHERWLSKVPKAKFYLIKNAGHCLWLDNFPDYKEIMRQIL